MLHAQTASVTIDGPPPPIPPAVLSRDAAGAVTVRAVRVVERIRLDGILDEDVYDETQSIGGFVQQVPDEGAPASEATEAWVLFDDDHLYVAARCFDSAPPAEWVANDMRRDTAQLRQNDTFAVILDTFYDRRNGVAFYTNPLGARADFAITNEGNPNSDWNPVWDVRTGTFEGGWTVEMEIPFRSLRYRPGPTQVWGFQLRRVVRRKNEGSYLTPLPIAAVRGSAIRGIFRVSDAATLVGLDVPEGSRNIEVKPYGIGGVTTDASAVPARENAGAADAGIDVKYGVTQNLTADFTVNTDFAQVEVDEQQVNLTRFSLFFPEKREFFLEGRGIFEFARGGVGGRGGGFRDNIAPVLFYSRRIGLEDGRRVPIVGGGRLTGKVGPFDVGAINIHTGDEPIVGAHPTNFTVVRVRRDLLRRSTVGALLTHRSVATTGVGSSQTVGVDGTFAFYDSVSLLGYYATTRSPGVRGEDASYQGQFEYDGDRYGFQANHMVVEDHFAPDVGFIRRDNFRRSLVSGRFSPRPQWSDTIRQLNVEGTLDYIVTADTGRVETRQHQLRFQTELESSDQITVVLNDTYELLGGAVRARRRRVDSDRRLRLSGRRGALSAWPAAPRERHRLASPGRGTSAGTSHRSTSTRATSSSRSSCQSSRVSRSIGSMCRRAPFAPISCARGSTSRCPRGWSSAGCCNTTRTTMPSAATFGFGGNTAPEASSSSSTRRNGTPTPFGPTGSVRCATGGSSSRSTGCSGSRWGCAPSPRDRSASDRVRSWVSKARCD